MIASKTRRGLSLLLLMTAASCSNATPGTHHAEPARPDGAVAARGDVTGAAPATPRAAPKAAPSVIADVRKLPLKPFAGDDDEVELFSAAVTAYSCASRATASKDMKLLGRCSPMDTISHGFALVDTQDNKPYLLKEGSVYTFELEGGYGGTMDVSGSIIGTRGGVPVIEPEEYSVTPRPKPGAFKGCL